MIEIKDLNDLVGKLVKVHWLRNNIIQWEWLYLIVEAVKQNGFIILHLVEHDEESGAEKDLVLTPQEYEDFIIGKPCAKDEDTYLGNDYKHQYTLLLNEDDN